MTAKQDQLLQILSEHDREIGGINTRISELGRHVEGITSKIDTILSAISSINARPSWSIKDTLDATLKLFALIGVTVTFVTFVASERFNGTVEKGTLLMQQMDKRLDKLETEIHDDLRETIKDLKNAKKSP